MRTRLEQIYELLTRRKILSVEEICSEVCYSRSTVRRDLLELEAIGAVQRRGGKAVLIESSGKEKHRRLRACENVQAKQRIAFAAGRFIKDGMSLFFDSSTTVQQLCPLLLPHKNLTVITNSLETAVSITEMRHVELFFTGGYWRNDTCSILGETAVEYVRQFRLDLCFLSCSGIDRDGIYEASSQESYVKQAMMGHARASVLLCDQSKFNRAYKFRLADFASLGRKLRMGRMFRLRAAAEEHKSVPERLTYPPHGSILAL